MDKQYLFMLGLLFALLFASNGLAQYTSSDLPGPLSKLHADFETDCNLCHSPAEKSAQRPLCLSCHSSIADDLSQQQGFHGKNPDVQIADCNECHSEHEGRDVDLRNFDPDSFDHKYADFTLQGVHREIDCKSCHNSELINTGLVSDALPVKYRYAPNQCDLCHTEDEPHDGNFGKDCSLCHFPVTWDQLSFDHDLSRFPLIGSHDEVDCDSCHSEAPATSGVRTCRDCHLEDDNHAQRLSLNCARCHNPNGWDRWQFNHNLQTTFALRGEHQNLECTACHKTPANIELRISKACVDCHRQDDNHRGEFGYNCDRCHQPTGFKDIQISN